MSLSAKRISIFKADIPAGVHLLTISEAKSHKKSNGELITYEGNPGVVITYSDGQSVHQEIYWVNGYNYHRLRKLLHQVGVDDSKDIQKKELIGKQFWGFITEYKYMRGVEEVKSEKHLTETAGLSEANPFLNKEAIVYKESTFNPDERPAF